MGFYITNIWDIVEEIKDIPWHLSHTKIKFENEIYFKKQELKKKSNEVKDELTYSLSADKAITIQSTALKEYNCACEKLHKSCEHLHKVRTDAIRTIEFIQVVINSIANKPWDLSIKLGEIEKELTIFKDTEEYAKKAKSALIETDAKLVAIVSVSTATTFGKEPMTRAIKAISDIARKKLSPDMLKKLVVYFPVKGAGKAFLSLSNPLSWGVTVVTTTVSASKSLSSLKEKNMKIADEAIKEAIEIRKEKESLDETIIKINSLCDKTTILEKDLLNQKKLLDGLRSVDFDTLGIEAINYLGSIINNTISLSELLNKTVE